MKHEDKLDLQYKNPSVLIPWDKNPRKGVKEAAVKLAKSIEQMGFINPIVCTPDLIVRAGHTRLQAAQKLGLEEVPVIIVPFWTEEEAAVYAIADNRTGEYTSWDRDMLGEVLANLHDVDAEELQHSTSFTKADIMNLQLRQNASMPDTEQKDAVQKLEGMDVGINVGDIFEMGPNRLMCGDASNLTHVNMLMEDKKADLIVTDPPYGIDHFSRGTKKVDDDSSAAGLIKRAPLANDESKQYEEKVLRWFKIFEYVLRPGGSFYIWGGYTNAGRFPACLTAAGLNFKQCIVWLKNSSVPSMAFKGFRRKFELGYYGWKLGELPFFDEMLHAKVDDVIPCDRMSHSAMLHLTEKPVQLLQTLIDISSRPMDLIVDLFAGSGSTLEASHKLGRSAYLMELNPVYCKVILDRWEAIK